MASYQTQQRKIMLDFLDTHPHEGFSARQLAEHFSKNHISQSAVYRNLSSLEKDGFVRRYTKSGSREIYFQYIAAERCQKLLHITCLHCGSIVHSSSTTLEQISQSLFYDTGFVVDAGQSVVYGSCRNCTQNESN